MEDARPRGVKEPQEFPGCCRGEVEAEQLAAFDGGMHEWWLVIPIGPGDDPDDRHFAE